MINTLIIIKPRIFSITYFCPKLFVSFVYYNGDYVCLVNQIVKLRLYDRAQYPKKNFWLYLINDILLHNSLPLDFSLYLVPRIYGFWSQDENTLSIISNFSKFDAQNPWRNFITFRFQNAGTV